jgi:hypothetical protein
MTRPAEKVEAKESLAQETPLRLNRRDESCSCLFRRYRIIGTSAVFHLVL